MALLLKTLIDNYRYVNDRVADPRTKDWFLIGSPWGFMTIIGVYLYFVQSLGPRLMAGRKPFSLERTMQIYNIAQVLVNGYLFCQAVILFKDNNFRCEPLDRSYTPKALSINTIVYQYFIVKIIDMVDTVFFVLRKKQNQVSFLHVYHHTAMVLAGWIAVKWIPGGHLVFLGLINFLVHTVMYAYYLLTSLKMSKPWWKKYITQMQMLQFFLIFVHASQLIWEDCDYPKWPAALLLPQNLFMVVLFGDFYYKAYVKKPIRSVEKNGNSPSKKDE